jgi:hypothetical protein
MDAKAPVILHDRRQEEILDDTLETYVFLLCVKPDIKGMYASSVSLRRPTEGSCLKFSIGYSAARNSCFDASRTRAHKATSRVGLVVTS